MISPRILAIAGFSACLLTPVAHAQFIGDALAAGGIALTEAQAIDIMAARRGVSPPAPGGTIKSGEAQTAKTYDPATVGTDVGIRRSQQDAAVSAAPSKGGSSSGTTAAGGASTSTGVNQPQVGGSTGVAGGRLQAQLIDPVELSSWQAAMKPVGTSVKSLPSSAEAIKAGAVTLYYEKGVFYEKRGAAYVAVAAPVGAAVESKPLGSSTVFAGGKPHIYYFGTFYVYDGASRAYVVVAPPAGAIVDYLPDTAKKVEWQGATHYQYAGTYYKPYYRGSSLVFEVAGTV